MIFKQFMKYGSTVSLLLLGLWLAGFFLFVGRVTAYIEPIIDEEIAATDAIVVLTGGSERLESGLNLLRAGKAKKLLVSGVYPSVTSTDIAKRYNLPAELVSCCVVLGRSADNTFGNAAETENFMKREGFLTLRLVTAHYHMPRSLFLFNEVMPDTRIYLYPVSPDSVALRSWWRSPGTLSLLAFEYCKYLYVRLKYVVEGWL
ncbi:MAG: YdcF family protein [Alphaproteobacteria bacterium]|nr:YdcF family protein [Alphaproteobacteria bacterium]